MKIKAVRLAFALLAGVSSLSPRFSVAQEEVPFVTTPDRVTLAMLELAGVKPSDRIIDLGSGDGRIVIAAAKRYRARATGVEIVPDLVERSRIAAQAAGVASRTSFLQQDLFKTDLSQATVITMYLLPEVNLQLRPKLLELTPGTRIVSHDWDMGDWPADRSLTLQVPEKTIGRDKRSRVHLWWVPAPVAGQWCGPDGARLQLEQRYQSVQGSLVAGTTVNSVLGRISGKSITLQGLNGRLHLEWTNPETLRQASASGLLAPQSQGRTWRAATAQGDCPKKT